MAGRGGQSVGWAMAFVLSVALGAPAIVGPDRLAAQPTAATHVEPQTGERSWFRSVLGASPDRDRLIFGLWTMHPFEPQFPELDWTEGFGGLYGHWFGATFVNSYDERAFILGIERNWFDTQRGRAGFGVGYRVGLITGYDERLVDVARHTPVLPFGGVLVWGRYGPLTIDSYYVYRAITLETALVF